MKGPSARSPVGYTLSRVRGQHIRMPLSSLNGYLNGWLHWTRISL